MHKYTINVACYFSFLKRGETVAPLYECALARSIVLEAGAKPGRFCCCCFCFFVSHVHSKKEKCFNTQLVLHGGILLEKHEDAWCGLLPSVETCKFCAR